MNNKMNKTGKTKTYSRLAISNVSEFMVENNIKSKTKLCEVDDEEKRQGKKILQVLFYLNQ